MRYSRIKNDLIKTNRINRIIDLMVKGSKRQDIVLLLSTEWNCSKIWVDKYIKKAKEVLREQLDNETIDNMNAKYDFLYQEALKNKNYKEARAVMDSKQKLLGIVSKLDITSGGEPINLKQLFTFENDKNKS